MTTHPTISVGYMDDFSKPLNKYLYKNLPEDPWLGTKSPAGQRALRNTFRCPADLPGEGMGRGVGLPVNYLGPSVPSPYELYGTSYMCNRGFMYDPDIVSLYYRVITPPITYDKVDHFNKGISKIVLHWPAAETYFASDIWFLWSLFYHQALPGAHSKQSIHNAVFLDGHAAPAYVTAADVQRSGPYVPGTYTPTYGDGWRETGLPTPYRQGTVGNKGIPWSGSAPFGGGTAGSPTSQ